MSPLPLSGPEVGAIMLVVGISIGYLVFKFIYWDVR